MLRVVALRLPVLICTDVSTDKLQHPIRRFRLQVPCFPKSPSFGLLSPAQPAVLPSQPCVPQLLLMSGHGYTAERDLSAVPNLAGLGRHSSRNAFYGAPGLQGSVQPEKRTSTTNPYLNQMTTRAGSQSDASLLIRHRPCHDPLTLGTTRVHARAHSDSFTLRPTRCQTQSRSATRAAPPMLRRAHDQPQNQTKTNARSDPLMPKPAHIQTRPRPDPAHSRPAQGRECVGSGRERVWMFGGPLRNKKTRNIKNANMCVAARARFLWGKARR